MRRRGLSAEERRLWDEVARTAIPLRPEPPRPPEPLPERTCPAPRRAAVPERREPPQPVPPRTPEPAAPRMDRRRFERMCRGRLEPEARLDLHGMSSERAHAALSAFIRDSHARDRRLVLVITGKGREDSALGRHGILRHSVPHWLAAPPLTGLILEIAPAHHRHGGAGAAYVYLRRRR
jgi:DNA-nicking Smr family endonuclease